MSSTNYQHNQAEGFYALRLLSLLLIFIIPIRLFATEEVMDGDFKYEIDKENRSATVTGLSIAGTTLTNPVFPDEIILDNTEYPVLIMGEAAFRATDYNHPQVTGTIKLPVRLKRIERYAFFNSYFTTKLSGSLVLPPDLEYVGEAAFAGQSFTGGLAIPSSVSTIEESAFRTFSGYGFDDTLTVDCQISVIPRWSFWGCGFNAVMIGNSVKGIEEYAFAQDDHIPRRMKCISFPDHLEYLGNYAFQNALDVLKIDLPSTFNKIGLSPFSGCMIDTVICRNPVPPFYDGSFDSRPGLLRNDVLLVPKNSIELYKDAPYWKYFKNIQGLEGIAIENISLTPQDVNLNVGQSLCIVVNVFPEDADDVDVVWHSSDSNIATVGADGTVTAVSVGVANITATCGDASATCKVTVNPVIATTVTINVPDMEVFVGDKVTLTATIVPDNTTDKSVVWACSTPDIAEIDARTGELTAISPGEARITATCGAVTGAATVTVKPILATSVTLSVEDMTLFVGQTGRLTATVVPANTTDATIVWKSDNGQVATVGADGTVTAVSAGVANITAICGPVSATCKVTVNPVTATTVTIEVPDTEIYVGDKVTLTATVVPDNTTDKSMGWFCSTPDIATINAQTGELTALAPGEAKVTAVCGEVTGTATITVKPILATSVTLSAEDLTLLVGQADKLTATVTPANTTDATIVWTSDNEAVATVEADGTVVAVSVGSATITAACGAVSATCKVAVDPVLATTVTINVPDMEVFVGDKFTMTATVTPDNTTDNTVIWASLTPEIASIDGQTGELTALAPGEARITASCGEVTGTATITVKPILATSVTLSAENLALFVGQTGKLTATVTSANTTDATVVWKSDNAAIATVGADGTVTAVSVGVANITATCGEASATCKVTVNPVTATTVTINVPDKEMFVGDKVTLTATIVPDNTTDKSVVWSCSTPDIAEIDARTGELTAISPGEARITATCGAVTGAATVTVKPILATSVTLSVEDMTLFVGQTGRLTATVVPANTTDATIVWKSDNGQVATVGADGTVAAVSAGVANITAICGPVSATCKVTVNLRLETPKEFVRKGDGASCTFVVMMNLTDAQLASEDYHFAYGYTDINGADHIIAISNHRYCHTSARIYNDRENDFWVYAYWTKGGGEIISSLRRHLDGRVDEVNDMAPLTDFLHRFAGTSNPDNWIKPTSRGAQINLACAGDATLSVHAVNGTLVYFRSYESGTVVTEEISNAHLIPNTYIITVQCGENRTSKKIIIR